MIGNRLRARKRGHDWTPIKLFENGKFKRYAKHLKQDRGGVKVRRRFTFKHLGYAAHVGFFRYFGMSYGLAPSEAAGSSTYVPITETNVADIKEEAFKGFLHPGHIIEDRARHLARLLTRQEDGAVVDTLTYSIREIVRNVVEHSESPMLLTFCADFLPRVEEPVGKKAPPAHFRL